MKHSINLEQVSKAERMAVLMVRYMLETIAPEDHDELDAWVEESELNMQLFEEMTSPTITEHLNKLVL